MRFDIALEVVILGSENCTFVSGSSIVVDILTGGSEIILGTKGTLIIGGGLRG